MSIAGPESAGLLYLAQRITSIPVGLIGGNLSRVVLGEAPKQLRQGKIFEFTSKIMRNLFLVAIVPAILGMYLAPYLAGLVFGNDWIDVANIVVYLIPAALLQFCVSPVSTVLHVREKQALAMVLQFIGLGLQVGGVILVYSAGWGDPIVGLAVGAALYYAIYGMVVLGVAKSPCLDARQLV
jgi:O-antigen/teichoic acid export membrane protein